MVRGPRAITPASPSVYPTGEVPASRRLIDINQELTPMPNRSIRSPSFPDGATTNVHLDVALMALEVGLSPGYPTEDGLKKPGGFWKKYQKTPATREEVIEWYRRGRTGNALFTGYGNLECLEFDDWGTYERFKEAAVKFGLGDLVERIEAGYCESSPGGGIHWLYRCEKIDGNTKLAERPAPTEENPNGREPLIETRGIGGFIVIAPSNGTVHPSGGAYTLLHGSLASIATIDPDEREALRSLARSFDEIPARPKEPPRPKGRPAGHRQDGVTPLDDFNARADHRKVLEDFAWKLVHTSGPVEYWRRPGKDEGWSATWGVTKGFRVFTSSTALDAASHTLAHTYCVLKHNGDWKACVKDLVQQGYGTWIDDDGQEHQNPPPPPKPSGKKGSEKGADKKQYPSVYILDEDEKPVRCISNTITWLSLNRNGQIKYDAFRGLILLDGRPMLDEHVVDLTATIEASFGCGWSLEHVKHARLSVAHANTFSSLAEYLEGLAWDGVSRIESFFADHYDLDDTPYHREVARVTFLSGAARGLKPGCKADSVPVLIGSQGCGKSTGIEALCPDPEWFTSEEGNIGADRAGENLRGKWIVEMAELSRVNQTTLESVKKFIVCQRDRYKVPYETVPRDFPRTNIFVASTNDDTPLRDVENRRFLPVRLLPRTEAEVRSTNATIATVRDQLWAEAVSRYKAGESWWTTDPEVGSEIVSEVGAARQEDPWEEILREKLEFLHETTVKDSACLLGVTTDKLDRRVEMRLSAALRKLGFVRKQRPKPPRAWYYLRTPNQP
jgi:Virulence-associated protein E/Bifunctional DNA primase/polymerase, N-terminal